MTQATFATAKLFRDRDFFVHDGSHLRRLRLSAPVQMGMLVATLLLLCWSVFVTARLIFAPAPIAPSATSISGDIARLAAATEARVAQIEQRQQVLAAMLSGAKVDPAVIAKLGYTIPADGKLMAQGGPFDAATKADPTFKSLFTSWKKLDNITDSAIAVPSDKPVKTAEFTSGYGIRSDPFQGRAARHQGIDLAAAYGTPIYATADGVVTDAGYGPDYRTFTHRLGHGIGLEGHEWPYLVRGSQVVLEPGMTFSDEPGIYIPAESLGVRIEDDILVTAAGAVVLSKGAPRTVSDIEKVMAGKR